MLHNFLGEVHNGDVHLTAGFKAAESRFNLEDFLSKDLLFESKLFRGGSSVYPRL